MRLTALALAAIVVTVPLQAQLPDAKQVAQERRQAEFELPHLVDVLSLRPGMTVADVGAGFGATTVVLGEWIGSGRLFATDVGQRQLVAIRDYVKQEGLTNVTVIEGAAGATNLPPECCDAIFMRDVYHHVTSVEAAQGACYCLTPELFRGPMLVYARLGSSVPATEEGGAS